MVLMDCLDLKQTDFRSAWMRTWELQQTVNRKVLDITHIWCRASADTMGSLVFLVSVPGEFLKCANPYFLLRCWKWYKSDQVALHSATQKQPKNFTIFQGLGQSPGLNKFTLHIYAGPCNGVTAAGCDQTEGERVAYEVIGKGVNPPQDCQALFFCSALPGFPLWQLLADIHHRFINLPYLLRQNSLQPIFEAYNLGVWSMGFPLLPLHECCLGLWTGADLGHRFRWGQLRCWSAL